MRSSNVSRKLISLQNYLKGLKSCIVAFSGGVDSSFLLKIAKDVLREKVIAVTFDTFFISRWEVKEAKEIARSIGVKHIIVSVPFVKNKRFLKNTYLRCYWCKRSLFKELSNISSRHKVKAIVDGTTFDDVKDYRPGLKANKEYKVKSPLKEARLSKDEIRLLAKKMGFAFWDKPSTTCFCSRIPFGEKITLSRIKRIEKAEYFLRCFLGKNTFFRLRDHNTVARIEMDRKEFPYFFERRNINRLIGRLKGLGYRYITVDLEGYRPFCLTISPKYSDVRRPKN